MLANIDIIKVSNPEDVSTCLDIRRIVFIEEQLVPIERERDDLDAKAQHWIIRVDGKNAGTARTVELYDKVKIQRVAILSSYRGLGLGAKLMKAIISDHLIKGSKKMLALSSQTHAAKFYENLGFIVTGNEYFDAGIAHVDMTYQLDQEGRS